ncbi:uncharacterized protein RJT20DRAFT_4213 [Scheffersomyces xylosifermentans]|uniref:uncharacterized protein n=1 Tax=Scheffersomyces xylosifermentans TaxID=1304137 RepID=UPI00315D3DB2
MEFTRRVNANARVEVPRNPAGNSAPEDDSDQESDSETEEDSDQEDYSEPEDESDPEEDSESEDDPESCNSRKRLRGQASVSETNKNTTIRSNKIAAYGLLAYSKRNLDTSAPKVYGASSIIRNIKLIFDKQSEIANDEANFADEPSYRDFFRMDLDEIYQRQQLMEIIEDKELFEESVGVLEKKLRERQADLTTFKARNYLNWLDYFNFDLELVKESLKELEQLRKVVNIRSEVIEGNEERSRVITERSAALPGVLRRNEQQEPNQDENGEP